jgi:phosphatidylinositol kinase/protein kinase (PI-3  family)
LTNE